ncbi:hypothetical protein M231_04770 [Tremella mesenterica]|uniref:Uncharacterized protein n=1 Tax=Tremella mesenterica TaxID=5217 RepID=A0A4Q1BJS7_TREME|nr:hypothetical protein M231_04770 [Tremella mesenterica]
MSPPPAQSPPQVPVPPASMTPSRRRTPARETATATHAATPPPLPPKTPASRTTKRPKKITTKPSNKSAQKTPSKTARKAIVKVQRRPSPSLSPPPNISAAPSPQALSHSSSTPIPDEILTWVNTCKPNDPVFASEDKMVEVERAIGHHIQPFHHCSPLFFPTTALSYGLSRWIPEPIPPSRSRGPFCFKNGVQHTCHHGSLPSFLYTLENLTCPNAVSREFPTLIWRYRITKDQFLAPHQCWSCFTSVDTRCSIMSLRLPKIDQESQPHPHNHPPAVLSKTRTAKQAGFSSPSPSPKRFAPAFPDGPELVVHNDPHSIPVRNVIPLSSSNTPAQTPLTLPADAENPIPRATPRLASAPPTYSNHIPLPGVNLDSSNVVEIYPQSQPKPPTDRRDGTGTIMFSRASSQVPPRVVSDSALLSEHNLQSSSFRHDDTTVHQLAFSLPSTSTTLIPPRPHELSTLRLPLHNVLKAPVERARLQLEYFESLEKDGMACLEQIVDKCNELQLVAQQDRQNIENVRRERDKLHGTGKILDARLVHYHQQLSKNKQELEEVAGKVKFLEGYVETARREQLAIDERLSETLVERDKAMEERDGAIRDRMEMEAVVRVLEEKLADAVKLRHQAELAYDDTSVEISDIRVLVNSLEAEKAKLLSRITFLENYNLKMNITPENFNHAAEVGPTQGLNQSSIPTPDRPSNTNTQNEQSGLPDRVVSTVNSAHITEAPKVNNVYLPSDVTPVNVPTVSILPPSSPQPTSVELHTTHNIPNLEEISLSATGFGGDSLSSVTTAQPMMDTDSSVVGDKALPGAFSTEL